MVLREHTRGKPVGAAIRDLKRFFVTGHDVETRGGRKGFLPREPGFPIYVCQDRGCQGSAPREFVLAGKDLSSIGNSFIQDFVRAPRAFDGYCVAGLAIGRIEGLDQDFLQGVGDLFVHDDTFGAEADLTVVGKGYLWVRNCFKSQKEQTY